eukprot:TRINITY_DN11845_c0_g1_i4.p1 TRINITY_DN11845_c0_g1~~TRINITY_DN11845_c0_g1_i4.p1  ORF type:complete len:377 (+),score=45.49 TRINITY_DN11845_c0_g1_i4:64-1194(+)
MCIRDRFSNLVAPAIVRSLGYRSSLFLSSLTYMVCYLSGLLLCICSTEKDWYVCQPWFNYSTNIMSNFLLGFSSSVLWSAQSGYTNSLCNEGNKGRFFGIFWSIMRSSMLGGSLLSTFVFEYFSQRTFYIALTIVTGISTCMFAMTPPVTKGKDIDNSKVKGKKQETLCMKMMAIVKMMNDYDMRCLFWLMLLAGIVISVYVNFLMFLVQNSFPDAPDAVINRKVSYVFVAFGFSQVVSGVMIGRFADKYNTRTLSQVANYIVSYSIIISLINMYESSYVMCFFTGILWGWDDCALRTMVTSTISRDFKGTLEGFSASRMMQGLGNVIGLLMSLFLNEDSKHYFMLFVGAVQMMSCYFIMNYKSKRLGINQKRQVC